MGNNSESAKRMAARFKAADPDHYRKLANMAKKPRGGKNSPGSFSSETAVAAGRKGGKNSKRGKGKDIKPSDYGKAIVEYEVLEVTQN